MKNISRSYESVFTESVFVEGNTVLLTLIMGRAVKNVKFKCNLSNLVGGKGAVGQGSRQELVLKGLCLDMGAWEDLFHQKRAMAFLSCLERLSVAENKSRLLREGVGEIYTEHHYG